MTIKKFTFTNHFISNNFNSKPKLTSMKKNFFQVFMVIYVIATTLLLIYSFTSDNAISTSFEEISVKRINIVDEDGHNRLVISNEELMPDPVIAGKEYKRMNAPAGIIFYDEKGDETGGIAISKINETGVRAIAFDYANADAIGLLTQEDLNGDNFRAGILINDKDLSGKPGSNISRMKLTTENGNAGLIINGPNEKPKISIVVDSLGNPSIQVFDKNGVAKEISPL